MARLRPAPPAKDTVMGLKLAIVQSNSQNGSRFTQNYATTRKRQRTRCGDHSLVPPSKLYCFADASMLCLANLLEIETALFPKPS